MTKWIFLLLFIPTLSIAQTVNDSIYINNDLEHKPEYKGGMQKFANYLAKHFVVPDALDEKVKIVVRFVIEKDGDLTNVEIVQDPCDGCGDQLAELISKSGPWVPGEKDGVPVRSSYTFPLTIQNAD